MSNVVGLKIRCRRALVVALDRDAIDVVNRIDGWRLRDAQISMDGFTIYGAHTLRGKLKICFYVCREILRGGLP